jgi:hypothetical protein
MFRNERVKRIICVQQNVQRAAYEYNENNKLHKYKRGNNTGKHWFKIV